MNKKIVMSLFMLILISLSSINALALDSNSIALEDAYYYLCNADVKQSRREHLEENDNKNEESIKGGIYEELPSWSAVRQIYLNTKDIKDLSEGALEFAREQNSVAEAVLTGFAKSSKWDKFRFRVKEVAVFDSADGEFKLRTDSKRQEDILESCIKEFDKKMVSASFRSLTQVTVEPDNAFTRSIKRLTDSFIGNTSSFQYQVTRIAVSLLGLQLVFELFYLTSDTVQPLLGWRFTPSKIRRVFDKSYVVKDEAMGISLVSKAAREVKASEWEVQDAEIMHRDIIGIYLFKKVIQLTLVVLGVFLINASAWGTVLVGFYEWLVSLGA